MTPPVPAHGPFHPGELAAQQLAGGGSPGGAIRDFMPDQHRRFFAAMPFVVVASIDDGAAVTTTVKLAGNRAGSSIAAAVDLAGNRAGSSVAAAVDLPGNRAGSSVAAAVDLPGNRADSSIAAAMGLPGSRAGSSEPTADTRWPVATIWTGAPGFVTAPDARTLRIAVDLDPADPATRAFAPGAPFGMLGIELATRRRNRANGTIVAADARGLTIAVHQSFGNCPKYIHPRDVATGAPTETRTELFDQLDDAAAAAITAADTFFIASAARTDDPTGGVDISHRGGPPGFVRITGNTLTIPDYPGNRYFNTLGNLLASPRAALLFVDFARGDLLHLQGTTEIIWDGPDVRELDGAERLWRFHVQRSWRRPAALPLRWLAAG